MLELNVEGYNLIEAGKDLWYLQVVGDTVFTGTFREVYIFAIYRIGFKAEDIDEAIRDMIDTDSNTAHFGTFKKFIYSFNRDFAPLRKAS